VQRSFSIHLLIVFTLVLCALPVNGAEDEVSSRNSRHLLMPLLGYQAMDSEQMSFFYNVNLHVHFGGIDTTFYADSSYIQERSVDKPMFGLIYRFRPSHQLNCDFTFAVIHDGESQSYKSVVDLWGFKRTEEMTVSRGNTAFCAADIGYNLPMPVKFLGLSVSGGVGYAWRSVKSDNDKLLSDATGIYTLTTSNVDAESMYMFRIGADMSLWKQNQLIIMGSLFYTQFVPTDSDIDPFGGIGWRMMIFPIWSGR